MVLVGMVAVNLRRRGCRRLHPEVLRIFKQSIHRQLTLHGLEKIFVAFRAVSSEQRDEDGLFCTRFFPEDRPFYFQLNGVIFIQGPDLAKYKKLFPAKCCFIGKIWLEMI
jgi:hypothetical protein